jgi:hypothetical protein
MLPARTSVADPDPDLFEGYVISTTKLQTMLIYKMYTLILAAAEIIISYCAEFR